MSAGSRALRFIQLGREATAGTAVAATTLWRGPAGGGLSDDRVVTLPDEDIGIVPGATRSYIAQLDGTMQFPQTSATFEQILHILEAGVETDTPTQDGAGTGPYIYEYEMPVTGQNTLKTYTLESGDDNQAEEMEHSFVESFTLSGQAGQALMVTANWRGRQVTATTKTPAITIPAVEDILFSTGGLYIDDSGGTIATTQIAATLFSMNLSVTTGLVPFYHKDARTFAGVQLTRPDITLDLTFLHNANAQAEKVNWRNEAVRLIRLEFISPTAFDPVGTTYNNPTFLIDLAGKWENFEILAEQAGNSVVTGRFRPRYSADDSLFVKFTDVVDLATIP